MKSTAAALLTLLTLAIGGWGALSTSPEPKTTGGDGSLVAGILAQIVYQSRSGQTRETAYTIQEPDLNAFLKDQLDLQQPAGLEKVAVELLPADSFITWLTVDMDQIDLGNGSFSGILLGSLLSGKQTLELEGQLEARNGQGTYTARRAELNGTSIPLPLLNTLLVMVGKRLEPPFDPTKPFRLPYGVNSIHVSQGEAVLKTGQDPATP